MAAAGCRFFIRPDILPDMSAFGSRSGVICFPGILFMRGVLDAFYPSTEPAAFMRSVMRVETLPVERIFPGHHNLELSTDIIRRVRRAFESLAEKGLLRHGAGIFDFGDFGIHI